MWLICTLFLFCARLLLHGGVALLNQQATDPCSIQPNLQKYFSDSNRLTETEEYDGLWVNKQLLLKKSSNVIIMSSEKCKVVEIISLDALKSNL